MSCFNFGYIKTIFFIKSGKNLTQLFLFEFLPRIYVERVVTNHIYIDDFLRVTKSLWKHRRRLFVGEDTEL